MRFPKILYSIFAFLVMLFLTAEMVLRIQEPKTGFLQNYDISRDVLEAFVLYEPHESWDHTLKANLNHRVIRNGTEQLVSTNNLGFRHSRDLEASKPPGVFRIFVLGDSFTEGLSSTGPAVSEWIQEKLSKNNPAVSFEVVNAGVSSESLIPYIIRLRNQIFSLEPDLVVVNVDNSDVRDDSRLIPFTNLDGDGIPLKIVKPFQKYQRLDAWIHNPASDFFRSASRYSFTCRLLWNILFRIQAKLIETQDHWSGLPKNTREILFDYTWIFKKDLTPAEQDLVNQWEQWITALAGLCHKHGVPLLLTSYPHPENYHPEVPDRVRKILTRKAKALGVPYFDAQEVLSAFQPEQIFIPEDMHYNSFGTQKWGEALGEFVSRELKKMQSSTTGKTPS